ncbi:MULTISPECIES: LeuD/DmdB family oxidoreductase small subunit [Anaerotruncus]|uniref:3-isopropylmalate dehydratase n=1 Tax=Anaerotruncus colihominis TaxID=169435 RepID=A0A845SVK2_9FIRM|nr:MULTISPECIES: 3-isopropylmalate dehydratase [Anaerotruncus]MCI8491705.1 3-isopropylmalate dehydratase [Anaerotruncus sp.]MCR2025939.1 3-isopropylmalate dehydratase [Anaerotruncus colihominis]NDO38510.1 3-isopropylmalate dehydratase [Anaerotruncus colihominis]
MTGKAIVLGDNVSGDQIIGGNRLAGVNSEADAVPYLFEACRSDFASVYKEGDILAAGENFGCGSSREQIILVMRAAGIRCVVARSFSRHFYRSGINMGVLPLECDAKIRDGDTVTVDLEHSRIQVNDCAPVGFTPFPKQVLGYISEGGLLNYYKKHHTLK